MKNKFDKLVVFEIISALIIIICIYTGIIVASESFNTISECNEEYNRIEVILNTLNKSGMSIKNKSSHLARSSIVHSLNFEETEPIVVEVPLIETSNEPATTAIETIQETLSEPTQPVPTVPLYSVNNVYEGTVGTLDFSLQEYAYRKCQEFGIEFYYPWVIAQMYQESRYNQGAVSPSGDYGLMQIKGVYHQYMLQVVGHPEWDLVNDPFANIYVGLYIMAENLRYNNYDIGKALTDYHEGPKTADTRLYEPYINDVSKWVELLIKN